jgi:uncharacterized phage-associated protein
MAVTRLQLSDWRNNPVTQALFRELKQNIDNYIAEIINRQRADNERDQFIRAYVKVADDVVAYDPPTISESDLVEVEDVED